MLIFKRQKLTLVLFLLVGVGYFSAMSNLEINYFLKSLIAIIPMQVGAVIYTSHQRWSRR
jgi:flagellar motor component MotA